MRQKLALAAVIVIAALLLSAAPGSANVIPGNPKVGSTAVTRMWCFQGTVTFRLVGPGVSIVVGTTQAGPLPDGEASISFTVPNVTPGAYTMVGSGTGCDNRPYEVRVPFSVRPRDGDGPGKPKYPPTGCYLRLGNSTFAPGANARVQTNCFPRRVDFTFGSSSRSLGVATPDADGSATLEFVVPDVPSGDYEIGASGTDPDGQPISVSTVIGVVNPSVVDVVTPKPAIATPTTPNSEVGNKDVAAPAPAVAVLGVVELAPERPAVATPAPVAARGLLARTGVDSLSTVRLAILLLAAGAMLVTIASRRTRRARS